MSEWETASREQIAELRAEMEVLNAVLQRQIADLRAELESLTRTVNARTEHLV